MDICLPSGATISSDPLGDLGPGSIFSYQGRLYRVLQWRARQRNGQLVDYAIAGSVKVHVLAEQVAASKQARLPL